MDPERAQALLLKAAEKHVDLTPHPSSQTCARATPSSTGHLRSVCVCVRVCVRASSHARDPTPPHHTIPPPCLHVCPHVLVRACLCACVCACVRACVRVCVRGVCVPCVVRAVRGACVRARVGAWARRAGWRACGAGNKWGHSGSASTPCPGSWCCPGQSRQWPVPWPGGRRLRVVGGARGEGTRRVRACVRACVLSRTRPHPIHFPITLLVCVPSCACVPACVRAYVRARMRACVRACVVRPRVRVSARGPGGRTGGPAGPGSALASSPGSWCCPGRSRQWPVPWPGCRWLRVVGGGGYGARHAARGTRACD